jgi:sarcosine oxidase gamma subunit
MVPVTWLGPLEWLVADQAEGMSLLAHAWSKRRPSDGILARF